MYVCVATCNIEADRSDSYSSVDHYLTLTLTLNPNPDSFSYVDHVIGWWCKNAVRLYMRPITAIIFSAIVYASFHCHHIQVAQ